MTKLRQHVKERHPKMKMRRSQHDLAYEHANFHHRMRSNHIHVGEPENRGIGRVVGWATGEVLMERPELRK